MRQSVRAWLAGDPSETGNGEQKSNHDSKFSASMSFSFSNKARPPFDFYKI